MIKRLTLIFAFIVLMVLCLTLIAQDTKDIIKTTSDGNEELRMERLAIVVGVGDYLSNKVSDLKYTVSDAEKMAQVLTDNGIFDVMLYTTDGNMNPTKDNIESALQDANYLSTRGMIKSFLFYFSGHGFQKDDINYLAPMEINPANLEVTGINLDKVLELIESIQENAKVMVFMDACRNDPSGSKGFGEGFAKDDESHGYGIFYSTSPGDYSWEVDRLDGGVYTYYLLRALKGEADEPPLGNGDGYVSFSEATAFVTYGMRQWSKDNPEMKQLPWESTNKTGEFYITKKGDISSETTSNNDSNSSAIKEINPKSYSMVHNIFGHTGWIYTVSFSHEGNILASGSHDKSVIIWDTNSGDIIHSLEDHSEVVTSLSFSPDDKLLASGSRDNTIKIWDVDTGKLLKTLEGHEDDIRTVCFSPDGKHIASGSWDNSIYIWDVESGRIINNLEGHSLYVMSVEYSPDGKYLASGSEDQRIKIWDGKSYELIRTIDADAYGVTQISFSPDSKLLANSGNGREIKIWDVKSGRPKQIITGETFGVFTIDYSPDGKYLATGSHDKVIKIFEVNTGNVLATLSGHDHWVNSVAFSPDGRWIASGSSDKTIKIWGMD